MRAPDQYRASPGQFLSLSTENEESLLQTRTLSLYTVCSLSPRDTVFSGAKGVCAEQPSHPLLALAPLKQLSVTS